MSAPDAPDVEWLRVRLVKACEEVTDIGEALDRARDRRRTVVLEALGAGLSAREVGRLVGISHVAVLAIGRTAE